MADALAPLPEPRESGPHRRWSKVLLGWLVLLASALMLAATLVAFDEQLHWSVRMLTAFRPHLLLGGIAVLACVAWWRYFWLTRLVCVFVIVVNAAVLWPWLWPAGDNPPDQPFLLMSWNTWRHHPDPGQVIKAIEESGADVVTLVEAPEAWMGTPAPEIEGYVVAQHSQYLIAVKEDGPVKLQSSRLARPPNNLEATLQFQGEPFLVLVTHRTRPTTEHGHMLQDAQHLFNKRWEDRVDLPYLMVGDFNATPWCAHLAKATDELGLRDASRGHGVWPTYPASPPVLSRFLGVAIDHCFYTPQLATGRRWVGQPSGSNHRPVFIEFGWR